MERGSVLDVVILPELLGIGAAVAVVAIAAGIFFTYNTPSQQTDITQTQQLAATIEEEEALETVATDYYSEELAMMDYYQYIY